MRWRLLAIAMLFMGFAVAAWSFCRFREVSTVAHESSTHVKARSAQDGRDVDPSKIWVELEEGFDYIYHDTDWAEDALHDAWFIVDSSRFNALNQGSDQHWGVVVSVSGEDNRGNVYDRRGHKLWRDARGIIVYADGTVKEEIWYRNSDDKPDAQVRTLITGSGPQPLYRIRITEDVAGWRSVEVASKAADTDPWQTLYQEDGMGTVSTARTNRIGIFSTNGQGLRGKMGAQY